MRSTLRVSKLDGVCIIVVLCLSEVKLGRDEAEIGRLADHDVVALRNAALEVLLSWQGIFSLFIGATYPHQHIVLQI